MFGSVPFASDNWPQSHMDIGPKMTQADLVKLDLEGCEGTFSDPMNFNRTHHGVFGDHQNPKDLRLQRSRASVLCSSCLNVSAMDPAWLPELGSSVTSVTIQYQPKFDLLTNPVACHSQEM